MYHAKLSTVFVITVMSLASMSAHAGPILAQNGDIIIEQNPTTTGTAVADPVAPASISSLAYGSETIFVEDANGDPLYVPDPAPSWWHAPGLAYTTTTNTIDISFSSGMNVVGFTFTIAANMNAMAYVDVTTSGGSTLNSGWFGGLNSDPSQSIGVYTTAGSGQCIDSVVIDPSLVWGVGNFTVIENANCNAEAVPIPPAAFLFISGMGLLGTGGWIRKRKSM